MSNLNEIIKITEQSDAQRSQLEMFVKWREGFIAEELARIYNVPFEKASWYCFEESEKMKLKQMALIIEQNAKIIELLTK